MFRRHFLTAAVALIVSSCAGSFAPSYAQPAPDSVLNEITSAIVTAGGPKITTASEFDELVVRKTIQAILDKNHLSLPTQFENGTILHGLVEINNDALAMRELHMLWSNANFQNGDVQHIVLAWERLA